MRVRSLQLQALSARLSWYSAVSVIAGFIAILWLRAWEIDTDGMFTGGGDLLYALATAQSHGDSGVFGRTTHLAWPIGYSAWALPQLGVLFGTSSWIAVGVFGASAVTAVYAFWILAVSINAACVFFFLRSLRLPAENLVSAVLAISLAVGAFSQTRFLHPNVTAYFIVPLVFGVVIRLAQGCSASGSRGLLAVVFSAGFISGLWWVLVTCLIVFVTTGIQLIHRRWNLFREHCLVLVMLSLACLGQLFFHLLHRIPGLPERRLPWDSNLFGGHFVDLLLASPAINTLFPRLATLGEGASLGNSLVGTVPALAALTALIITLVGVPKRIKGSRVLLLRDLTVVSILFFVLGGLGNLQAGLAVLVGVPSPARAWSRLIVVLAILGMGWILLLLFRSRSRRHTSLLGSVVLGICIVTWLLDSSQVSRPPLASIQNRSEHAPVSFLRSSLEPCPVAQLPRDGFPLIRVDSQLYNETGLGYRGFVPYLMAPEFSWSFGSWTPQAFDPLTRVGISISADDLERLGDAGFCALLYDKELASASQDIDAPLEGSIIEMSQEPDYRSSAFDVYILHPPGTPFRHDSSSE